VLVLPEQLAQLARKVRKVRLGCQGLRKMYVLLIKQRLFIGAHVQAPE
jgi:hypothetical protein